MKSGNNHFCILDGYTTNPGDLKWSLLESLGDLTVHDRTSASETVSRAAGCDAVITNKVILDRDILSQLPDCRGVFLMSTGTNAVDLVACRERGIPVCNIPAYSTASVAELVFAYLLDWARSVPSYAAQTREGVWTRSPDFCYLDAPQRELAGRTLGLVGFGDIAQAVTRIARAVGMEVAVHTPRTEGKPDLGQRFVDLETVFSGSDAVSLHCPLNAETEHLVNPDTLRWMRHDAVLINTGRGGLVDEPALAEALASGRIGGAYLDVLSREPPGVENPLLAAPGAHITPHIAWATRAARARLIRQLAANLEAWLKGSPVNVVNGV